MLIRHLQTEDIADCACLLIEAYNGAPWNNHWTTETATHYLSEFAVSANFIGFVAEEGAEIIGAMFAHRRTWWTQDEGYVDELFVHPASQGKGCGKRLLEHAEAYCKANGLAGLTLLTDRNMPAKAFYEKNGYTLAEHVIFFYKVV
jgi:aminoglycoside 6'-N-acetyltransferase I